MQKHFNTAGPIQPENHYHIDPLHCLDWEEVQHLIDTGKYFVLHAPRQTGKTSTLLAMSEALNEGGVYKSLYVNIEAAQALRGDVDRAIAVVCQAIAASARVYKVEPTLEALTDKLFQAGRLAEGALTQQLSQWAEMSDKPIVLMLDEVDALVGDTLISLLRQIRAGYAQRPQAFPQSIILCGVRDVRDYRIHSKDQEIITGGSAFNIKAKSLVMGSFTQQEITALYQQHTAETGQVFEDIIFPELWEDTRGQPWLVNALGYDMTWEDREARDRSVPITLEKYLAARERLIRSRQTHLDQLTDKLREPRIHRVVSALLSGASTLNGISDDDLQYVEDLGLIVRKPQVHIANAIYQEIIPREIVAPLQDGIPNQQTAWYVLPDGRLDMPLLLRAFQQFFRENAEIWLQGLPFKEAGPHLILQAFLQRIVNGGGRINREYALGRKYTDLVLEWPLDEGKGFYGEVQRVVLELKILRGGLDKTIADGVAQVTDYAQRMGAEEAYLVIFDRDPELSWDAKIWEREGISVDGLQVGVWGC